MAIFTLFLIVLIVALIIGNLFLSVTEKEPKFGKPAIPEKTETEKLLMPSTTLQPAPVSNPHTTYQTEILEKRLDRLEGMVLRAKGNKHVEAQCQKLVEDVRELRQFQNQTEIRLAVRKNAEKKPVKKQGDLDEQKLHDLIYNKR
jgi:hypothetical protein